MTGSVRNFEKKNIFLPKIKIKLSAQSQFSKYDRLAHFDDELRTAKRLKRTFESVYRQSKIVILYRKLFMEASNSYNVLQYKKREKFYQTILDDHLNLKFFTLFKKLMVQPERKLPSFYSDFGSANKFNDFFIEKIEKNRD